VHRRFLILVAAATILLMVFPPLFDTFDTWDKTPEIPMAGHNAETNLVALALEVGVGLAVAWASVLLLNWLAAWFAPRAQKAPTPVGPQARATDYLLWLFSPPWALISLRI
jgi:hypothetical protein